eukprot:UN23528
MTFYCEDFSMIFCHIVNYEKLLFVSNVEHIVIESTNSMVSLFLLSYNDTSTIHLNSTRKVYLILMFSDKDLLI